MYKGSSTYHINSCETIEMFYNIRTDLDKLKYAIHINKIVQDVTQENQNCYKILQLLLNTLYVISQTQKNLDFVLSVFKLRLLCILGFTPRIKKCTNCQEENKESDIKLSPSELLSKSIENYKLYLENEKDASDYNDVNQKIKELEDKLAQSNEKQ